MIQIILGIILLLIGGFVFYKFPIKNDVKQMTLGALFIVLVIVLKRLAIMVPFLGFPSLKITLEVLPLIIAGLCLSPSYCYIIALASDGLGLLLASAGGFPFFGFTLNACLQTLIPCFIKMKISYKEDSKLDTMIQVGMTALGCFALVYLWNLESVSISSQVYEMTSTIKIGISAIIVIMISLLFLAMFFYRKRLNEMTYHRFNIVVLSVVLVELCVTFLLTPYWLEVMYGIPFFASLFVRVIKACVMIPVGIVIVQSVYQVIYRVLNKEG